jgi:hypothetical protein
LWLGLEHALRWCLPRREGGRSVNRGSVGAGWQRCAVVTNGPATQRGPRSPSPAASRDLGGRPYEPVGGAARREEGGDRPGQHLRRRRPARPPAAASTLDTCSMRIQMAPEPEQQRQNHAARARSGRAGYAYVPEGERAAGGIAPPSCVRPTVGGSRLITVPVCPPAARRWMCLCPCVRGHARCSRKRSTGQLATHNPAATAMLSRASSTQLRTTDGRAYTEAVRAAAEAALDVLYLRRGRVYRTYRTG